MVKDKLFVVIGLGSFGTAVATQLAKNKCRVTGMDQDRDRVDQLKGILWEGVVADATQKEALEVLPLKTAESVIISMGENITLSILATFHVMELGAHRVIVKGVTDEHGQILKKLDVHRVVFPEKEIAEQLADKETWPNVIDNLALGPGGYAFVEVAVPDNFAGKTLRDIDLRRRFGLTVVGVRKSLDGGDVEVNPSADFLLMPDHVLLMIGKKDEIERFRERD